MPFSNCVFPEIIANLFGEDLIFFSIENEEMYFLERDFTIGWTHILLPDAIDYLITNSTAN